jgi:hypothetical protein
MKISHNKYKNSGILFELLVRQITTDTLSGVESPAIDILKKFFVKTELSKEYKLYETLLKKTNITEGKADIIINTILESAKRLNKTVLKREKYNLIKEIKAHYNLDEFFKTKLPNYKIQAAFYNLIEITTQNINNPEASISNKLTILEHLVAKTPENTQGTNLTEEFAKFDKDTRILSYKIILEKFNSKYTSLNNNQKSILKEYINLADNNLKLRDFYNNQIVEVKKNLIVLNKNNKDRISKIKINEIISLIKEIDKTSPIKPENMVNLLQYHELADELKKINLN